MAVTVDAEDGDEAVIVALGSNLGGKYGGSRALLEAALLRLPQHGLTVRSRSRWWRSAAWPDPGEPDYLNGVVIVETALDADGVLAALLAVEHAFGRRRSVANAPRTLDLDLVAHGRVLRDDPSLTTPHPRAHRRLFVMGPLAEIAPAWRHPRLLTTAAELAASASDGRDAAPCD